MDKIPSNGDKISIFCGGNLKLIEAIEEALLLLNLLGVHPYKKNLERLHCDEGFDQYALKLH